MVAQEAVAEKPKARVSAAEGEASGDHGELLSSDQNRARRGSLMGTEPDDRGYVTELKCEDHRAQGLLYFVGSTPIRASDSRFPRRAYNAIRSMMFV